VLGGPAGADRAGAGLRSELSGNRTDTAGGTVNKCGLPRLLLTVREGSAALIRRSQCLIGGVALRRLEAGRKLVEGEAYTVDKGLIRDDVVVAAAQVLHKRVTCHDDPC
jgi:hypothetical protein